jgi:hypothetical protein
MAPTMACVRTIPDTAVGRLPASRPSAADDGSANRCGDRVDAEQTILPALCGEIRLPAQEAVAFDAAVDHDMRHVNAERPILARHALRHHPQPCFGRRKLREAGLAA